MSSSTIMRLQRVWAVLVVAALLAFSLRSERHDVTSVTSGDTQSLSGPALVDAATSDAVFRRDGKLYDASTLAPGMVREKDCKT